MIRTYGADGKAKSIYKLYSSGTMTNEVSGPYDPGQDLPPSSGAMTGRFGRILMFPWRPAMATWSFPSSIRGQRHLPRARNRRLSRGSPSIPEQWLARSLPVVRPILRPASPCPSDGSTNSATADLPYRAEAVRAGPTSRVQTLGLQQITPSWARGVLDGR